MSVEMVAFDVAGTTLNDDGIVITAFKSAFERTQPDLWPSMGEIWTQYAIETMGQSKIHVFTELLGDAEKAHQANVAFEESYLSEIAEIGATPIAGAEDLFRALKKAGIAVVLTTGFSRSTLDVLLETLNWRELIDLSVTPSEVERGRPHADMLNFAAKEFMINLPENTMVVGDTAADMQAGVAFGAKHVIGVLTGAHNERTLNEAGATSVVNSIVDISSLI
ncbi:MAG: HAD family hydrolase [Actinomycetales bacterium]|nr:MAG: HAD family hydrolase [Actinomycetales bacterium]